jgi:hypothetical protein
VRSLLMPPLGNHGLWLAMLVHMAARGLWLGACYLRIERAAARAATASKIARLGSSGVDARSDLRRRGGVALPAPRGHL